VSGSRSTRVLVVLSGAALVGSALLSPLLSPALILPVSLLWYLALAVLLRSAYHILRSWTSKRIAAVLVGLTTALPVVLTAIRPPPALALILPCPRNYGWLPAWLLRSSPLTALRFSAGDSRLKLCYGSPAARGRRMLGGSRVPYGRLWRTGANEPTTLISSDSLDVAGIVIPPGRTALYTIPGPESWEVILTAATSQWGIESEYSAEIRATERGRTILPSERGEFTERLRFRIESRTARDSVRADLVLAWEATRLRIPIRFLSR
jgi:hypothetical protein